MEVLSIVQPVVAETESKPCRMSMEISKVQRSM